MKEYIETQRSAKNLGNIGRHDGNGCGDAQKDDDWTRELFTD